MKKIKFFIITKSVGFLINLTSYTALEKAKLQAYRLFSSPRKGKLHRENLPKTLRNTTLETFHYDGEDFQTYIWPGNEEIILLVHGWESNASRWKKLLPYLKPLGKTIIAIDAPAHGLSEGTELNVPKYAECLNVLIRKYQPKTIIGHSVGGAAIAYYLNKYQPEAKPNGAKLNPEIEKVVLLGAPSDFKIISDNFVKLLSLNSRIETQLEAYYQQKFNIHINDFSGHKFAQNFSQKALIAHDTEDSVVLIDEGRKYAKAWKNSIYIETSGLGHSMHDANLYQKIVEFISEA
ncbi:MAG TPA: alpha/beta fold hydrolase [Flavobacterium sp.]|uniref:alpha/beta fold hydrolase n=1 Tax=Flavobacterium sp. TaxID=239 RepID=UPI002B68B9E2|nr:alpha/beta fold hydrolase [Flavobacterium sp.]HNP32742.1 alpha/beta fold hydrolase [Flavobacterium sp.]